jgi:hypothetical protein
VFAFVALTFAALPAWTQDQIFVLAKPMATRFVMAAAESPENRNSGTVIRGHVVRTRLQVLRVIHGAVADKEIVVQLTVDHEETLRRLGSILVLLSKDQQGDYQVQGWLTPEKKLACLPASVVSEGLRSSLPIHVVDPPQRCARL